MGLFDITINGVKKLIIELNPHKVQGPNGLPPRFLKDFASEIAPALILVFQASLTQGQDHGAHRP